MCLKISNNHYTLAAVMKLKTEEYLKMNLHWEHFCVYVYVCSVHVERQMTGSKYGKNRVRKTKCIDYHFLVQPSLPKAMSELKAKLRT